MKRFFLITVALLLMAGYSSMAQTFVPTVQQNKNALIEEFTGSNCTYCPIAHRTSAELIAANPGRVFAINIHTGSYAISGYMTSFGSGIANLFTITGYPAVVVNRGSTVYGSSNFVTPVNNTLTQPAIVNVAAHASIDMITRLLTVNVEVYYTGSSSIDHKLNVALIQSGILGNQVGGSTYNPSNMVGNLYSHNHMLRHLITGQWGERLDSTSQGAFFSKNYTYSIPEQIGIVPCDMENMDVIVFITENNNKPVVNSCEAEMTLLNNLPKMVAMKDDDAPACSNEALLNLLVKNKLNVPLTSMNVAYQYGGQTYNYQWTGSVAAQDTAIVHLPSITMDSTVLDIEASLTQINGENTPSPIGPLSFHYQRIVTQGTPLMNLLLVTDRKASETSFSFYDMNGNEISSGGPFTNSSSVTNRSFTLRPPYDGCYVLEVRDSGNDGINNGNGQGFFKVFNENSALLAYNDGIFLDRVRYYFNISGLGINDLTTTRYAVYPNPSSDFISIETNNTLRQTDVYNAQGQLVMSITGDVKNINVSQLAKGIYSLRLYDDNGITVKKLVKK